MTRREKRDDTSLIRVSIKYVAVPDAEQRLARSIDLLLRAADSHVSLKDKKSLGKESENKSGELERG